ncbi:hypothetical protein IT575_11710 [bacterium]|nr:hypothetical protein [bacterium]
MPRITSALAGAAALCLGSLMLTTVPAFAGESTSITGFDRWTLGDALPAEGDEFWGLFSGPLYENFGGTEYVEYETTYELTMPSGVRNTKVTVGYGPENLLEVIIVDMGVLDEPLEPALAGAFCEDIIAVLAGEYSPELLVIDAFPGGPDRSETADPNTGTYVMADEAGNSIWLTWDNSVVQTMYASARVSEQLILQTFGSEALGGEAMPEDAILFEDEDY